MKKSETETRRKIYIENVKSLKWMKRNLGNHQESAFIREAVEEKISGLSTAKGR